MFLLHSLIQTLDMIVNDLKFIVEILPYITSFCDITQKCNNIMCYNNIMYRRMFIQFEI